MEITPEFRKFCTMLHQDVGLLGLNSAEQLIEYGLSGIPARQRVALAEYLRALTSSSTSDNQLCQAWNKGGSDLLFKSSKKLRQFLSTAADIAAPE